jgi:hypothetical protein
VDIGGGPVAYNAYGDDYMTIGVDEADGSVVVRIRSAKASETCPSCGMASTHVHSTYTRCIQDTPTRNKGTWLLVTARKFDCENPGCGAGVFAESLPFAGRGSTRTHELTPMAMAMAVDMGNETASRALARIGAKVSNDTLGRIYAGLEFGDDPLVEEIGVDDVSNRRGVTHLTVIYDLGTHRLLALLKGRDGGPLKEWLRAHPKVRLVARDRSSAYSAAISEVLPDAVQVADRFHLLDNLTGHIREIVNAVMPDSVFPMDGKVLETPPPKTAKPPGVDPAILDALHYDNSPPVGDDGLEIWFDGKNADRDSRRYVRQDVARGAKQRSIRELKAYAMGNPGVALKRTAEVFGVSPATAGKRLSMTEDEVDAMDSPRVYRDRGGTTSHKNAVYKMLRDNVPPDVVYGYVRRLGHDGNPATMLKYMENVEKNNFPGRDVRLSLRLMEWGYPEGVTQVGRGSLPGTGSRATQRPGRTPRWPGPSTR